MDDATFEAELAMCKKLSQENGGGCNWGKCADCGVVPLLHKLSTGMIIDDQEAVKELKKKVLGI